MTELTIHHVRQARRRVKDGETVAKIARDMGVAYSIVRDAVTGRTWAHVADPAPIDNVREWRKRPLFVCISCGCQYKKGGTTKRCNRCDRYWRLHKIERGSGTIDRRHHKFSRGEAKKLYQLYRERGTLAAVAEEQPFSVETLRRAFVRFGYELNSAGRTMVLTSGLVHMARHRVHGEGEKIRDVAESIGVSYATLYAAVMGKTWHKAGGPLPTKGDTRCRVCQILTDHPSGLCRFCR